MGCPNPAAAGAAGCVQMLTTGMMLTLTPLTTTYLFVVTSPLISSLYQTSSLIGSIGWIATMLFIMSTTFYQMYILGVNLRNLFQEGYNVYPYIEVYNYIRKFLLIWWFVEVFLWLTHSSENIYEPCVLWITGFIGFSVYIGVRIDEYRAIEEKNARQRNEYFYKFAVHGILSLIGFSPIVLWVNDPGNSIYEPITVTFIFVAFVCLYRIHAGHGVLSKLPKWVLLDFSDSSRD